MPLDAGQVDAAKRLFIQDVFTADGQTATVTTEDIEAAITSLVSFVESNAVAINNALPEPFRSAATLQQKRHLFGLVSARLAGIGI